jgi:glucose dehydrogenase
MKLKTLSLAMMSLAVPGLVAADALATMQEYENKGGMPAGDYKNPRYSELTQINKDNVKELNMAWSFSTAVLRGHEGNALVMDGTMYVHTPFPNIVYALDLKNDVDINWKY